MNPIALRRVVLSAAAQCCVAGVLALSIQSRAYADGWLDRMTGPRAAAQLRETSVDDRRTAARALGRIGARGPALTALRERLDHERDPSTRETIFESLTRRNDREAVPHLVDELHRPGGAPPMRVAQFLGAFATPGALGALVASLGEVRLREAARAGLVRAGTRSVGPVTRAVAQPALRLHAVPVLGDLRDPRATPALVEALRDERKPVRIATLQALAAIGDPRAAAAVVLLADDERTEVRRGVFETLSRIGTVRERAAIVRGLRDPETEVAVAATIALCSVDPAAGASRLLRMIEAEEAVHPRLVEFVRGQRHSVYVALMLRLSRDGLHAGTPAWLAEVEGGAGVGELRRLAANRMNAQPRLLHTALAVALRRWRHVLLPAEWRESLRLLRQWGDPVLRALAGDERVRPRLLSELRAESSSRRRMAVGGLAALESEAPTIANLIERENDPDVFRVMARALVEQRHPIRLATLRRWMEDYETAPEALALAALAIRRGMSEDAYSVSRTRRAYRRALTHSSARIRAGAARAAAIANDRGAWRTLVEALEDVHPDVRRAAARALGVLQVRAAQPGLEARFRVEPDLRVATTLADASRSLHRRPPNPFGDRGPHVLWVKIAPASGLGDVEVERAIEAILSDGRWIRARTSPDGEWLFPDVTYAPVNVQVGLRGHTTFQTDANAAR